MMDTMFLKQANKQTKISHLMFDEYMQSTPKWERKTLPRDVDLIAILFIHIVVGFSIFLHYFSIT